MKNLFVLAITSLLTCQLSATVTGETANKRSTSLIVPIDEKATMKILLSPDYSLDTIESATLKAFRKIVGYDTFDSIRKTRRNTKRDPEDYYNVTMSMLISRRPADLTPAPARDIYNAEGKSLTSTLDKGFPYDD